MRPRCGERLWIAWLVGTIASFGWLEYKAIRYRNFPTLSETMQRWMGLRSKTPWGRVSPGLFLTFWVWFVVHVVRGDWGAKNVHSRVLDGDR